MAISTFSELKTAAANWLARSNLTSRIPEFVSLCEADFNRKLRIRAMETLSESATTTAAGSTTSALPTGWLQGRSVWLAGTTPKQTLRYVTPEYLHSTYVSGTNGTPKVFTIVGDYFAYGPSPDAAYPVAALYYKKLDALSDTTTTNWLLTNAPDAYLYGTLLQAMPFLRHDARMAVWGTMYNQALSEVQSADERDRHSGSALMIRSDTGNP